MKGAIRKVVYWITFVSLGLTLCGLLAVKGVGIRLLSRKKARKAQILFLPCLPDTAASARHRVYKYLPYLDKPGFEWRVLPPTSVDMLMNGLFSTKVFSNYRYFIAVFFNRFSALWSAPRYSVVFVQRDILSEFFLDPPLAIAALKLLNPNIIYDVDDAMFMLPPQSYRSRSRVLNALARWRFAANCRFAKSVIVGNPYLAGFAR